MLAERISLATIHGINGIKEETVMDWLCEAANHIEEIEALLLGNYPLKRIQLDAIWIYVGHKGEEVATAIMSQIRDRCNPEEPPAIASDGNDSYPKQSNA
jgi:hypothetical protein